MKAVYFVIIEKKTRSNNLNYSIVYHFYLTHEILAA